MNTSNSPDVPPHGRLIAAGLAGACAVGLLLNHFAVGTHHVVYLMILCLGPIGLFLGIGGMVEPKILWSVGKDGQHLPAIYKVVGGCLGGLGVVVTMLLLVFVYRLGPDEAENPPPQQPRKRSLVPVKPQSQPPAEAVPAEQRVAPQEVIFLTYIRDQKRWEEMDAEAKQGVRREEQDGVVTLHYAEGTSALLKVLWPDVLAEGERFAVDIQGANSMELVDLAGADANARAGLPPSDQFIAWEITRGKDKVAITANGQPQKPYYASGKARGDEAKTALLATALKPAFTIKKGEKASFRQAAIIRQ